MTAVVTKHIHEGSSEITIKAYYEGGGGFKNPIQQNLSYIPPMS